MNNIKEFQVGDYIDTSNLNKEEKKILAEVMRNNGIVEEYKPIENYSYPYWVIDSGMQINGAESPTQDKLKKELTPEQAVFVGAPEWATVIVGYPSRHHAQYMESVGKGKQRFSHIISRQGFGEEGTTISSHGWDESKIIFKREDVKVNNSVDTQIEKLQQELDELKRQREEEVSLQQKETWEPKGGEWTIDIARSTANNVVSHKSYSDSGLERENEVMATKSASLLRKYSRLLAYVQEYAPEWDQEDDSELSFCVYSFGGEWLYNMAEGLQDLGAVTMPKEVAIKLCDQLNDGTVVL